MAIGTQSCLGTLVVPEQLGDLPQLEERFRKQSELRNMALGILSPRHLPKALVVNNENNSVNALFVCQECVQTILLTPNLIVLTPGHSAWRIRTNFDFTPCS